MQNGREPYFLWGLHKRGWGHSEFLKNTRVNAYHVHLILYVLPTSTDLEWRGMKKPVFLKSLKKNIWLNYKLHISYGNLFFQTFSLFFFILQISVTHWAYWLFGNTLLPFFHIISKVCTYIPILDAGIVLITFFPFKVHLSNVNITIPALHIFLV